MACIVSDVDAEMPEWFTEKMVRARKAHQCGECGCEIQPGQRYERATGEWYGEFVTHATCVPCASMRDEYLCDWVYGGVRELLMNALYMDPMEYNEDDFNDEEE